MSRAFRVNSPQVMHETIDGEVIVIDLTTGTYYSLRESGAAIWHAIEQGQDEQAIVAALEHRYTGPSAEIRQATMELLAELEREGLVTATDAASPLELAATSPNGSTERSLFRAPVLEKHSDMQELILLDPVHEVGTKGWPHPVELGKEEA